MDTTASGQEVELRKLALEERKLTEEMRHKQAELEFQREQFLKTHERSHGINSVVTPVTVAVLGGLLGLFGTVVNGWQDTRLERQKQQTSLIMKTTEEPDEQKRARTLLFYNEYGYLPLQEETVEKLRSLAHLEEGESPLPESTPTGALVHIPPTINAGLRPAADSTLMRVLGSPGELTRDCSPAGGNVRRLLVTEDVGPFTVTGIRPAVAAIQRIFAEVAREEPELFNAVGTAGMLCVRAVRRPAGMPSNRFSDHSWGTAIDLTIEGRIDPMGDGRAPAGLVALAPYFEREKFFWGAGESGLGENAMHFEASEQLIREWESAGLLR